MLLLVFHGTWHTWPHFTCIFKTVSYFCQPHTHGPTRTSSLYSQKAAQSRYFINVHFNQQKSHLEWYKQLELRKQVLLLRCGLQTSVFNLIFVLRHFLVLRKVRFLMSQNKVQHFSISPLTIIISNPLGIRMINQFVGLQQSLGRRPVVPHLQILQTFPHMERKEWE